MAEVYRANDKVLGRQVALKVLNAKSMADEELRKRLVQEARAAATLVLPSVVQVHDIDPSGRFIVMELVQGETLSAHLRQRGALPNAELRALAKALLTALGAAHARGIVHRDVKPSNILLTPAGAKLTDFGVAQMADGQDLTRTGMAVGTVSYMAPEQLRGAPGTPRSDLYSAAVTLYEAATATRFHDADGRPPAYPLKTLLRATKDRAFSEAIARTLAFDPQTRFASAAELLLALDTRPLPRRALLLSGAGLIAAAAAARFGPQLFMSERDRQMAVGIDALKLHDLERANAAFATVLVDHPRDSDALYFLTLVSWWLERDPVELQTAIDKALAAPQPDARKALLEGLMALEANDYPKALDYYEAQAPKHPDDRDVTYALFEARYHGGYPSRAMDTYAQLRRIDPSFHLGDMHFIDYQLAHGELDGLEPLLKQQAFPQVWLARLSAARGELKRASDDIIALVKREPDNPWAREAENDLALLSGDSAQLARLLPGIQPADPLYLATVTVTGDDDGWRKSRAAIIGSRDRQSEYGRASSLRDMLLVDSMREGTEGAEQLLELIKAMEPRNARGLRIRVGAVLQLRRLKDRAGIEAFRSTEYPELNAVASAVALELDGDFAKAAESWRAAITASAGGEYLPVEWLGLARCAEALHDDDALLKAAAHARHPYRFSASWCSSIAPTLLMIARAQLRRGDTAAAMDALKQLVTLRSRAASDDVHVAEARALQERASQ
jgi:serine/threonine-protein kinase